MAVKHAQASDARAQRAKEVLAELNEVMKDDPRFWVPDVDTFAKKRLSQFEFARVLGTSICYINRVFGF